LHVRLSISVGVAEREDSAAAGWSTSARSGSAARWLRVDEDITVGRDDDMSGTGRAVSEDSGAEASR